jgi:hypothetical protein
VSELVLRPRFSELAFLLGGIVHVVFVIVKERNTQEVDNDMRFRTLKDDVRSYRFRCKVLSVWQQLT